MKDIIEYLNMIDQVNKKEVKWSMYKNIAIVDVEIFDEMLKILGKTTSKVLSEEEISSIFKKVIKDIEND